MNFANPWLLAGLAAVGLPVLIHFLTRARPRAVAFPPFRFLMEACAGQQAVHRLRTIVLLTLRCLAIVALAALFARPFLKPAGKAAGSQSGERVVLLIDASLSMRAVDGGVTLFSRAKSEAADVLRGLESSQEAAVIFVGATARPLLPALSRNLPALHDRLVREEPTFEAADFQAGLAAAVKMLGNSGTLYIFSDFQKSNWEKARELPAGVTCRLRRATRIPVENVALTGARLMPEAPVAGESVYVVCSVFNSTARPRQETVRLELGDFVQKRDVNVPPFSTADCAFEVKLTEEGILQGKAWLDADSLREDNTRYLATRVQSNLRILLVSDADQNDTRSAAYFVSRALVPSAAAAPGLSVTRRHGQDADRGVLETSDLFILVGPATLSGEAVEIITRRVQEGARLVAVLDGPTAPAMVLPGLNPPLKLGRTAFSEKGVGLKKAPGKLFADQEDQSWEACKFHRYFQGEVPQARAGEVLLSYSDGSPALTLSTTGRGAAVFANMALTPDACDFVGNPMFPSMLHEVVRALRKGEETQAISPGSSWVMESPAKDAGDVVIADPQGARVDGKVVSSGRMLRIAMPPAQLPGIYLVKQGESVIGAGAVNADVLESDTRPIALEELKSGTGGAVSVVRDDEELLVAEKSRPLWPHLAAAAAIFLGLEMLLLALWKPGGAFSKRLSSSTQAAVVRKGARL